MAIRVLILDASAEDVSRFAQELADGGLDAQVKHVDARVPYQQALVGFKPDIVLADSELADIDAPTAIQMAHGLRKDLPFIVVSSVGGETLAVDSLHAGADDFVLKRELGRLVPAVVRAMDRTRALQDWAKQDAALRESEERLRQFTENTDLVFWMTDHAVNQVVYISSAYEKVWGRKCEELLARPGSWTEVIHPADRQRVTDSFAKGFFGGGGWTETYRIIRPDGTVRWIRDRAFEVRNDAGEAYRIAGFSLDITERRALEEQLRHAQKMEAVGRLAGGIAHGFNNLLTMMMGHLDMAEHDVDSRSAVWSHLQQARTATERAAALTRQLLTFSRHRVVDMELLDLNAVILRMQVMLRRLIGDHIEIRVDLDPGLGRVHGDASQMEQVIVNLAVNARDAMPDGGRLVIATCHVMHEGEPLAAGRYVQLTFADDGFGVAPDAAARVFDPFFTTRGPGVGNGLGLATVYAIIRQHGGFIWLDSSPDQGATFRILLPWNEIPDPPSDKPFGELPAELRSHDATILVAEDEHMLRLLVGQILERAGYTVLLADSADKAEKVAAEHPGTIDLLLTDVVMPGRSGPKAAKRIRELRPEMKVVYMSGYIGESVPDRALVETGDAFLSKPFAPPLLLDCVHEVLASR